MCVRASLVSRRKCWPVLPNRWVRYAAISGDVQNRPGGDVVQKAKRVVLQRKCVGWSSSPPPAAWTKGSGPDGVTDRLSRITRVPWWATTGAIKSRYSVNFQNENKCLRSCFDEGHAKPSHATRDRSGSKRFYRLMMNGARRRHILA